jgi:hypothetical protein
MEPQVIHGPVLETVSGIRVVYQVTVGQGLRLGAARRARPVGPPGSSAAPSAPHAAARSG